MSSSVRKTEIMAFIKKHHDFSDERIPYDAQELFQIVREAKDLISSEPSLLEVRLPILVVGDVHGQFKDLRRIFTSTGTTGQQGAHAKRFLFLGGS
ncbi:Serine/threonine-protein phosphatase [Aphelenchoides fujianensis]|nr:Serine/threonine-protein phosphatase [Aphelenchoides fujianensis]